MKHNKADMLPQDLYLAKRALQAVFRSVRYPTLEHRDLLRDSYMMNLSNMVAYARENGLKIQKYIKSIQSELLKDSRVRKC